MLPVTWRFSITAPSSITLIEPLGVSFVPAGTPVFVALGFGPEHTEPLPPPEPLELDVLAEPPPADVPVVLAEPPPPVVLAEPPLPVEPVVLVDEVPLLHAAPPATVAAVRTKKTRVRMIHLLPGRAGRVPQEGAEKGSRAPALSYLGRMEGTTSTVAAKPRAAAG